MTLIELLQFAKDKTWITGREPGPDTICIRITEADRQQLETALTLIEEHNAKLTCMCGSPIEDHGTGDGHSPVSMFDYTVEQEAKRLKLSSFTPEEIEEENTRRIRERIDREDQCT